MCPVPAQTVPLYIEPSAPTAIAGVTDPWSVRAGLNIATSSYSKAAAGAVKGTNPTVKASVTVASIAPMKRFTNRSVAISQNPMGNKWTGLDGRPFVGSR